ncbi:MAG: hypothetical protein GJ680_19975 [Alteromonadaceae bacterium]|nr:hypothetical protein [Alteromonadaceae bacterium]
MFNVGYIGSGPISNFHVPALKKVGLSVGGIATRYGSQTVESFAKKHSITNIYNSWQQLLADDEKFDCYVICVDTTATPRILEDVLSTGKKILVEKPAAWKSTQLQQIAQHKNADNVVFAYNRRFYTTVDAAKDFIQEYPQCNALIRLPDSIPTIRQFLVNGCHGVDLILYLFPDLTVEHVKHTYSSEGELNGIYAILNGKDGNVINLICDWAAPDNFAIDLFCENSRFLLCPFEAAVRYEGMEVIQPTDEMPIRRYIPKQKESLSLLREDMEYKPGFLGQYNAFKTFIETGQRSPSQCNFDEAIKCLQICEALLPEKLLSDDLYSEF